MSALTARELQVVQYAARGKTNKAIASELYLSEHTVKNYMFRAFEKLHVSNRVELLFYLAARGHPFGPPEIEVRRTRCGEVNAGPATGIRSSLYERQDELLRRGSLRVATWLAGSRLYAHKLLN